MNTNKPLRFLVFLTSFVVLLVFVPNQKLKGQEYSLGIGTDIPYQSYLGFNVATQHIDFNYRTGILPPPLFECDCVVYWRPWCRTDLPRFD